MKKHSVIQYQALKPTEVSVDFGVLDKARDLVISIKDSKDGGSSKNTARKVSKNQNTHFSEINQIRRVTMNTGQSNYNDKSTIQDVKTLNSVNNSD